MNILAISKNDNKVTAYAEVVQKAILPQVLSVHIDNESCSNENFFYGVMIDKVCTQVSSGDLLQ